MMCVWYSVVLGGESVLFFVSLTGFLFNWEKTHHSGGNTHAHTHNTSKYILFSVICIVRMSLTYYYSFIHILFLPLSLSLRRISW